MTDYPTLLRAELARLSEQVEAAKASRYIGDRILLYSLEQVAAGNVPVYSREEIRALEPAGLYVSDTELKARVRHLREILNQPEPTALRIIDGGKGKKEPKPVQVVGNLGMFE